MRVFTLCFWLWQIPGVEGVLAVVVMPRYVLHNSLGVRLQYRQQGTLDDRELVAGGAQPLRWADAGLPKRLCLRLQEAGWLWSGGVALDSPGDLFVKIRHRSVLRYTPHRSCEICLSYMHSY